MIINIPSLFAIFLFLLISPVDGRREPVTSTKMKQKANKLPEILKLACSGELRKAHDLAKDGNDARSIHVRSALELIINADGESALLWHEVAKNADRKVVPPLAKLYLDKKSCNGLTDIFYISAVSIKKLSDDQMSDPAMYTAHLTMITLLSDSGFYEEAENHLSHALKIMPDDTSLLIRSALMTPGVYESSHHLTTTRSLLRQRLDSFVADKDFTLKGIDEFALSPTFYFVYQGFRDVSFVTDLQDLYSRAYPVLSSYSLVEARAPALLDSPMETNRTGPRKLRIGFVSSHFRRHSICKLFCGIITGLSSTTLPDGTGFEVVVFSGQEQGREDAMTTKLKSGVSEFVRVNKFTVAARREVTIRNLDVLVYLDIGMEPSTSVWGASKLAPVQACVWGHPTTTGMRSMDYFISADLFHRDISYVSPPSGDEQSCDQSSEADNCMDNYNYTNWFEDTSSAFSEQLVRLPAPALGFTFVKPFLELSPPLSDQDLDFVHRPAALADSIGSLLPDITGEAVSNGVASLNDLVKLRNSGGKLVLIPQHLPKFHPSFDRIIAEILEAVPEAHIVITYNAKNHLWRRTLETRWEKEVGLSAALISKRMVWMQGLKPNQYLGMLALGDVMLDPFPFGGGVTTLEALSVCTPVLTLPGKQTVPGLTAGMLRVMLGEEAEDGAAASSMFIHDTEEAYIRRAVEILTSADYSTTARQMICDKADKLYDSSVSASETVQEWGSFLRTVHKNNFF